ncbi:tau 95 subunit of transcription factor TFIIIC [Microbotryomycetes sp. JL221]|nr:tau 95 subunit of transcription factor TFIIIC [Microbotryomycetes sp. JL221]
MTTLTVAGQAHLVAIEYPGKVKPKSINKALTTLGGIDKVSNALNDKNNNDTDVTTTTTDKRTTTRQQRRRRGRIDTNGDSDSQDEDEEDDDDDDDGPPLPRLPSPSLTTRRAVPVEPIQLSLNTRNTFHHPVLGSTTSTNNVVLKITKRRRKPSSLGQSNHQGLFQVQVAGLATRTVRFRAMADFQYEPNTSDTMTRLALSLKQLDAKALQSFEWPEPVEHFDESSFLPPPVFARNTVSQPYDYKQATGVELVETNFPGSGPNETLPRLINTSRQHQNKMKSISFDSTIVPPTIDQHDKQAVSKLFNGQRDEFNQVELKILSILEERPVWTRVGLMNQLNEADRRQVTNDKSLINNVSYTFSDGPWRDLIVQLGYDPRQDPEARFYQTLAFRNMQNQRSKAGQTRIGLETNKIKQVSQNSSLSHVFDGKVAHSKVGNFQLCDITDPLCSRLIHDTKGVYRLGITSTNDHSIQSQPHSSSNHSTTTTTTTTTSSLIGPTKDDGWWHPLFLNQIRQIVRLKFNSSVQGLIVNDFDCQHLLGDPRIVFSNSNSLTQQQQQQQRGSSGQMGGTDRQQGQQMSDTGTEDDSSEEEQEEEQEQEQEDEEDGGEDEFNQHHQRQRSRRQKAKSSKSKGKQRAVSHDD